MRVNFTGEKGLARSAVVLGDNSIAMWTFARDFLVAYFTIALLVARFPMSAPTVRGSAWTEGSDFPGGSLIR